MCRIRSVIGSSAQGPSAGPHGPGQVGVVQRSDPGDPAVVGVVELGQRRRGVGGVRPALVVGGRTVEVRVVAHREDADDDVCQPPRDGGERRGLRARKGEVDAAIAVHGPAVGDRLPEVLVVGQAVQARPQRSASESRAVRPASGGRCSVGMTPPFQPFRTVSVLGVRQTGAHVGNDEPCAATAGAAAVTAGVDGRRARRPARGDGPQRAPRCRAAARPRLSRARQHGPRWRLSARRGCRTAAAVARSRRGRRDGRLPAAGRRRQCRRASANRRCGRCPNWTR